MKRKYSNIISLLLIFVIIISASPVKKLIDDFEINNKIEDCKPSQQEIEMFNEQVPCDTTHSPCLESLDSLYLTSDDE